jgi:nucleoside-diphosphate-sugar epimerase
MQKMGGLLQGEDAGAGGAGSASIGGDAGLSQLGAIPTGAAGIAKGQQGEPEDFEDRLRRKKQQQEQRRTINRLDDVVEAAILAMKHGPGHCFFEDGGSQAEHFLRGKLYAAFGELMGRIQEDNNNNR